MSVEVTLWFFAGLLVVATANLLIAMVLLRRRRGLPAPAIPVLDILALVLIVLVLMAAMIADVLLIVSSAPAIGRPALYVIGAVTTEALNRLFALLPNTPWWLPRVLRIFEVALLVLAAIGVVLTIVPRLV